MYVNSGYLNNSRAPIKDKSRPLIVTSCGTYRLKNTKKLPTWRPKGRLDYQLLYVLSGKAHFFFNGEERIVNALIGSSCSTEIGSSNTIPMSTT